MLPLLCGMLKKKKKKNLIETTDVWLPDRRGWGRAWAKCVKVVKKA